MVISFESTFERIVKQTLNEKIIGKPVQMTNPYPKPRWDLENDVLRLEQMIILYEQEIEVLKTEREELLEQVTTLQRKLKYYKTIVEEEDE